MQSKQGFSLVEILVVTAIIVVIFGIVYASLGSTREKARQSVCISNLKQLGLALHMYLQDYDAEDNSKLMATIPTDLDTALKPYGGDRSKYTCLDQHPPGDFLFPPANYSIGIVRDPAPPLTPSTEWLFQRCGGQMVVFADVNHNFPSANLPPTSHVFWILSRYDGSVTTGYYHTFANINWINPCFENRASTNTTGD